MWVFGKWVSIRCKKDWPILVATLLLYGRLNHITFRWRLSFLFSWILLGKIGEKYEKNSIGLYRDDGLSVFKNKSGTQLERIKKNLQETFKDFGLEIVAESNLKCELSGRDTES